MRRLTRLLPFLVFAALAPLGVAGQACPEMPLGAIEVCLGPRDCASPEPFDTLQEAFDFISEGDNVDDPAYLRLEPGWYVNPHAPEIPLTFDQIAWRHCDETDPTRDATAGFLLRGRRNVTFIESTTGRPEDVIIWGRVPPAVLADASAIFHGVALVDNTAFVRLTGVTLVADGGYIGNGAGDATLYLQNTVATLWDSFVLANKSSSNALWGRVDHDQEGVVVDGGTITTRYSAIGGNIHTGVMVLNRGRAHLGLSVVQGNGWDGGTFQNENSGHGVTSFYEPVVASCLDGDNEVSIKDSLVRNNTGDGVLIRGEFVHRNHLVMWNQITGNHGHGVAVDGGWNGGVTTLEQTRIKAQYNNMSGNALGNFSFTDYELDDTSYVIDSPNSSPPPWWATTGNALYERMRVLHRDVIAVDADRDCHALE